MRQRLKLLEIEKGEKKKILEEEQQKLKEQEIRRAFLDTKEGCRERADPVNSKN